MASTDSGAGLTASCWRRWQSLSVIAVLTTTEILLPTTGWLLLARLAGPLHVWRASWRILVAGAGMGLALAPFHSVHGWHTVAAIGLGAAVYGVLLIVVRTFDAEERSLLRRALGSGVGSG